MEPEKYVLPEQIVPLKFVPEICVLFLHVTMEKQTVMKLTWIAGEPVQNVQSEKLAEVPEIVLNTFAMAMFVPPQIALMEFKMVVKPELIAEDPVVENAQTD